MHQLFSDVPSDSRNQLNWRNRFGDVATASNVYNLYSSGDPVFVPTEGAVSDFILSKAVGDLAPHGGLHAWSYQERLKVRTYMNILGSTHGGWGYPDPMKAQNYYHQKTLHDGTVLHPPYEPNYSYHTIAWDGSQWERKSPGEMNAKDGNGDWIITNSNLRSTPFFDHGPNSISAIYEPGAAGSEAAEEHHTTIMARMIPASSNAVGHEGVGMETPVAIENVDMNDPNPGFGPYLRSNEHWPQGRNTMDWKHSDVREVAYVFIRQLFDYIVETGNLSTDE